MWKKFQVQKSLLPAKTRDSADNKAHVFFLAAEVLRGCCFFHIYSTQTAVAYLYTQLS